MNVYSEKTDSPSKNRVWDFFETSLSCAGQNVAFAQYPRPENEPMPTISASGARYYGYRFYSPSLGRWISRDPLEEGVGPNLFSFLENGPLNSVDLYGLFGNGHDGKPTRRVCRMIGNPSKGGRLVCRNVPVTIKGHSDLPNLPKCPFDFTREDRWESHPWIQPRRHFQPLSESEGYLDNALQSCDFGSYERAMHQMQDYYSHYENSYRWDPWSTNKCWGFGHACVPRGEIPPDEDMEGWERARERTQFWLSQWSAKCCIKKCSKCKWVRREEGGECEP